MGRALHLLIIFIGVVVTLLLLRRALARRDTTKPPQTHVPMRQCAHCGVHLPAPEALIHDERAYCCEAHRDAA